MLYEVQSATIVFFYTFRVPHSGTHEPPPGENPALDEIPAFDVWQSSYQKKSLADYRRLKFFPQVLKSSA